MNRTMAQSPPRHMSLFSCNLEANRVGHLGLQIYYHESELRDAVGPSDECWQQFVNLHRLTTSRNQESYWLESILRLALQINIGNDFSGDEARARSLLTVLALTIGNRCQLSLDGRTQDTHLTWFDSVGNGELFLFFHNKEGCQRFQINVHDLPILERIYSPSKGLQIDFRPLYPLMSDSLRRLFPPDEKKTMPSDPQKVPAPDREPIRPLSDPWMVSAPELPFGPWKGPVLHHPRSTSEIDTPQSSETDDEGKSIGEHEYGRIWEGELDGLQCVEQKGEWAVEKRASAPTTLNTTEGDCVTDIEDSTDAETFRKGRTRRQRQI